jgi:ornithine cyclodeaminase
MPDIVVLREADVGAALDLPSLIEAMGEALDAYSAGRAELPSVIHLGVPESGGEVHVKAGHLHGAPRYAVKVSSGFYAAAPPAIDGLVVVFDASDGAPVAFLLDRGYLTDARTGAAGGLAARHLAPAEVGTVAVIGTGAQARWQLRSLACVRRFERVRVWGRNAEHVERCLRDLEGESLAASKLEAAVGVEEAVLGADVVITCTASTDPLVRAEWVSPGTHVTAVGSDGPDKRELDVAVLGRADVLVVDSRDQCARFGELRHALDAGAVVSADDAVELGDVVAGRRPGRTSAEQITVCDLTGVGVQDVAAAALALERAPATAETIRI